MMFLNRDPQSPEITHYFPSFVTRVFWAARPKGEMPVFEKQMSTACEASVHTYTDAYLPDRPGSAGPDRIIGARA